MTESSSSSLSSRVCKHAMDAQHRKCNREHQGIPEAPQARCSAAGPLPAQPGGKLATTMTFWRRRMCSVLLGNCATLHPSVLGAHAVRAVLQFDFVFFHSFFIVFPSSLNYLNVTLNFSEYIQNILALTAPLLCQILLFFSSSRPHTPP